MAPLIDVEELAALLGSGRPVTLLDVRWALGRSDGQEQYAAGHLPRAAYVDLDTELAGPPGAGGRHPLPTATVLTAAMQRAGVSADVPVVAYDGGAGFGAARLWWVLTDAGHVDVRVLDGGYAAWVAAGGEVETGSVAPEPGTFVAEPGQRASVDADGVAAHLAAGGAVRDVRAPERFSGEQESVDPVAGHVPGATNLPVGGLTGPDGFASVQALRERFAGVRPGDVLMCGSGVTAAAAMLAGEQAGIEGLVLYPGSWSDWITDPTRPVAQGA